MIPLQIRGVCPHDCPDTCGFVTTVVDGRAVEFRGDPDNPVTRGWLCAKVRPYLDHVYHPGRILHPLARVGPKGGGRWRRISWDEAIGTIRSRWREIIAGPGPEAILPYSYSGTLGLVQMIVSSGRFWNRLGAGTLERSVCGAAAETAVEATLGKRYSAPYADVVHSRLVVLWGHNPHSTAPHFMPWLRQAQRQGCRVVVIDPRRTPSANGATHLAIRPGTDGVLAMGLARLLVEAGRHDEKWLDAHAHGWPAFRERLADFPLDSVSERTGVPAGQIRDLARLYADTRPGLIKIADGVNRNFNGGQNVRAILALPALTGQYGTRGGGLSYSTSGYVQWDAEAVHKRSLCPPPGRSVNMNRLGAALLGEAKDTPIRSLFVFGANPATSAVNSGAVVEGMRREDLFTVVHDLFMTDTAELADIILPATSQLEQTDLHKGYGTTQLTYNAQAIPPLGESKSNWEMMGLLARAMGFDEPWLHQTADEVIDEVLTATALGNPHFAGVTPARLRAEGAVPLTTPDEPPFAEGRFFTPSGKFEFHCEALAAQGYDPLPGRFRDLVDEPTNGLSLVTAASHHFVSSSFASQEGLLKNAGTPFVEIHPDDARPRGISDGDEVVLGNARGECRLRAVVTDAVRPGVVASPKGRWAKLSGGRNVNQLTTDTLGDMAGQASYHSSRVWVRRGTPDQEPQG